MIPSVTCQGGKRLIECGVQYPVGVELWSNPSTVRTSSRIGVGFSSGESGDDPGKDLCCLVTAEKEGCGKDKENECDHAIAGCDATSGHEGGCSAPSIIASMSETRSKRVPPTM